MQAARAATGNSGRPTSLPPPDGVMFAQPINRRVMVRPLGRRRLPHGCAPARPPATRTVPERSPPTRPERSGRSRKARAVPQRPPAERWLGRIVPSRPGRNGRRGWPGAVVERQFRVLDNDKIVFCPARRRYRTARHRSHRDARRLGVRQHARINAGRLLRHASDVTTAAGSVTRKEDLILRRAVPVAG